MDCQYYSTLRIKFNQLNPVSLVLTSFLTIEYGAIPARATPIVHLKDSIMGRPRLTSVTFSHTKSKIMAWVLELTPTPLKDKLAQLSLLFDYSSQSIEIWEIAKHIEFLTGL